VPALLVKLDELVRLIDDLPMANQLPGDSAVAAQAGAVETAKAAAAKNSNAAPNASFWSSLNTQALKDWSARTLQGLRAEAASLLRVSRIDQPEAALLAPDQAYFLRENIKLKLLNARLALLSRQTDAARSDLAGVQTGLQRYFDGSSRKTQAAISALQQVQTQLRSGELPRLTETLAALATAAAGR
jgi:uroporphyrin-3 C-methyltransferase